MDYYRVLFSNDYAKKKGIFGSAETVPDSDNLYLISDNISFPHEEIRNYKFVLTGGKYADWQMCVYPWRIISKRFKEVLEKYSDNHTYFHQIYLHHNNIAEEYYILHFAKTIGINAGQVSEHRDQVSKYNFQAFDDSITGVFFVSESVKNDIEAKGLTGMYFDLL